MSLFHILSHNSH